MLSSTHRARHRRRRSRISIAASLQDLKQSIFPVPIHVMV
jgi:hypothetical protein